MTMEKAVLVVVLTLMVLAPQGLSKGYVEYEEDYYYEAEGGDYEPPTFTARPQAFTVEVGQSVIIPCDVDNMGSFKLLIKKVPANGGAEKLLFAGREKITRDRRFSMDGSRVTISNARPKDAGTYYCMFGLQPPVVLRHTIDVQYAPTVRAMGRPEQHIPRGDSVTLECQAEGNPEPIIRWSRQEGPLPSGKRSEEAQSLTLEGVDRHVEGTYLCTADNGIGEAAVAAMSIIVEYPPEITTEKARIFVIVLEAVEFPVRLPDSAIVRTGEGDQVELVCLVRGRPVPEVVWTRDGLPIPNTDMMDTKLHHQQQTQHQQQDHNSHMVHSHSAHRHTLTIKHVTEKDFGAYMCIAKNSHGQKDATIQMTGLPKPPHLTSSPNGGESDTYTLTWETESYYPITEFLVKYRKTQLGTWQTNHTMVMGGSWQSISEAVDPDAELNEDTRHSMAYTLKDLEVATDYAAQVRVRNKYGWSSESETFTFSTKKALAVLQSTSTGGGARGRSALAAVTLLLAALAALM
ncbi:protein amalgam-like [Penaeus monodon]|uniref:protein amalgam-like n=1 Tax=Penaeus monodon TaxID=6687 RepID=UPI0018A7A689|nr:protein amalgam-like [Penaeus monodon]